MIVYQLQMIINREKILDSLKIQVGDQEEEWKANNHRELNGQDLSAVKN